MSRLGVLFICTGNICRSPCAEVIFNHLVEQDGLSGLIFSESRGTASFNIGKAADERAIRIAEHHGYPLENHQAKQFADEDGQRFAYLIGMDHKNRSHLQDWGKHTDYSGHIGLIGEFLAGGGPAWIDDPLYEQESVFEQMVRRLEHCCEALLKHLRQQHSF